MVNHADADEGDVPSYWSCGLPQFTTITEDLDWLDTGDDYISGSFVKPLTSPFEADGIVAQDASDGIVSQDENMYHFPFHTHSECIDCQLTTIVSPLYVPQKRQYCPTRKGPSRSFIGRCPCGFVWGSIASSF